MSCIVATAAIIGAVAATAGAVVSGVSAANQAEANRKQYEAQQKALLNEYQSTLAGLRSNYNSADKILSDYKEGKEQNRISILQTESDISSVENLLERWQGDYNYQMNELQTQGMEQFSALMSNWSNQEVLNAEQGKSGKTAEILETQQKNKLISYVGSDLKLNSVGGLYGQARNELNLDLMADKQSYEGQLGILNKSLDTYKDNAGIYDTQIGNISESLNKYSEQITEYEDLIQKQQKVVANL